MIRLGDRDAPTRDSVLEMLLTICPEANLAVDSDGTVRVRNMEACGEEFYRDHRSCRCICHLISSNRTVTIFVNPLRAAAGNDGITVDASENDTVNGNVVGVNQQLESLFLRM